MSEQPENKKLKRITIKTENGTGLGEVYKLIRSW